MADYPSYSQLDQSEPRTLTGNRYDRSVSGRLRGQSFYTSEMATFKVKHLLTNSELSTLRSFRTTNNLLTVQFTWAVTSVTYGVIITDIQSKPVGNGYNEVFVFLEEVE